MTSLRSFWERWKRFGQKVGDFQARLLLSVFYYVFLGPFALAVRWGSDPLAIRGKAPQGWQPKKSDVASLEKATRQY